MNNTLSNEVPYVCKTYKCDSCNSLKQGQPWLSVNFSRKPYNSCSYLCNTKMRDVLPKGYYEQIINKEDFNEPRPVIDNPKYEEFVFLTETEINALSNDDYMKYSETLNDVFLLNPIRSSVYYEQLENDAYEKAVELEEDNYSDDGIDADDY